MHLGNGLKGKFMLCSVCGKYISFTEDVCLHCQKNKLKEQLYISWVFILGLVFGCVGYLVFDLVGLISGLIVGCIIAGIISGIGTSA